MLPQPHAEIWLSRLGYALGAQPVSVEESAEAGRLLTEPAELRRAGFATHHICPPTQSAYDLAREVSTCAQREHALDPDALIYATTLPGNAALERSGAYAASGDVKHLMEFTASHLQAEMGWDRAITLGVTQQACTGLLGAWRVGAALLSVEPGWSEVVCVSADRFPDGARYEQAYNPISDAATLSRLGRSPEPGSFRLLGVHQITNGALVAASDTETAGSFFTWMHRTVTETLEACSLKVGDVSWVVPQNTHRATWEVLGRLLGLEAQIHHPTLSTLGHMIAGDNVANLAALSASGQLREGQIVLVPAAGYGATWQCAVLEAGPQ